MLRVHNGGNGGGVGQGFTEFEEDIRFDDDDPDFEQHRHHHHQHHHHHHHMHHSHLQHHHVVSALNVPIFLAVPTKMSLASVHPVDLHSSHSSLTLSHSLDDVSSWSSSVEQVMTIEQLRYQLTSCFTCGVSWSDSHVSLDCSECGGYSMERPCPECEGRCGAVWKRDLTMSHSSGKARWSGECLSGDKEPDPGDGDPSRRRPQPPSNGGDHADDEGKDGGGEGGGGGPQQAQDICQRLEKLTAANS